MGYKNKHNWYKCYLGHWNLIKSKGSECPVLKGAIDLYRWVVSTLINFLAYRVFTHPFFIQLRIWNFNWVSSIPLRTLFSINWVKWKTIW